MHSSVNGHLGCFYVLVIVNSAEMNSGIHVSFQFWFPQDICLGGGLLGHMVILFLVFKGISIPSSIVAVYQFTFPPTMQEDSLSSTTYSAFIIGRILMMVILTSAK